MAGGSRSFACSATSRTTVRRRPQFARLLHLALVAPEAREPIASGYLLTFGCGDDHRH
jgi:hypothetical protein